MADLDSFFAKKDKKKLKGKKFTTTDEIAKRLEETEKKAEKSVLYTKPEPKKQEPVRERKTNTPEPAIEPEEQWKDFEEETQVDVTNLKISNLNIEEEENRAGSDGNDDNGSNNGDSKKDVWKVEDLKEEESKPKKGIKICDALDDDESMKEVTARVAAMNAGRWTSPLANEMKPSPLPRGNQAGSRRKKVAPDLNNAEAFPTLGSKPAIKKKKEKRDDRQQNDSKYPNSALRSSQSIGSRGDAASGGGNYYKPPGLRVNNRFAGLTDQMSRRN